MSSQPRRMSILLSTSAERTNRSTRDSRGTSRLWWVALIVATLAPAVASAEVVDRTVLITSSGQVTQLTPTESLLVENRNAVAGAAADVDGDGDTDVLVVHRLDEEPPFLFVNDGTGGFTEESGQRLPALAGGQTTDLIVADLDGDGDPDAYLGRDPQDQVWLNDGLGRFTQADGLWVLPEWSGSDSLAAADLTGDGRPEMLAVRAGKVAIAENMNGVGLRDATAEWLPTAPEPVLQLAVADVTRDGAPDVVVVGPALAYVLRNDHPVLRELQRVALFQDQPASGTATGDLDGDGDLDVVLSRPRFPLLLLNRGDGTMQADLRLAQLTGLANACLLADLNVDQRLDVLCAATGPDVLGLNPGPGKPWTPTANWLPAENEASRWAASADFSHDSFPDVYVARDGQDLLHLQSALPAP